MSKQVFDSQNNTPSQALMKRTRRHKRLPFETSIQRRKRLQARMVPTLPSVKDASDKLAVASSGNCYHLIEITANDIQKFHHCKVLAGLAHRLSIVYNTHNDLNSDSIMKIFDAHNWTCPQTGVAHSIVTPLTLNFVFRVELGGAITASNITPIFIDGLLPGEWYISRPQTPTRPRYIQPVNLLVMGA